MLPTYADTIVVGAGPAGCALTGRLVEGSDESILLLESGPDYGPFASGSWPADLLEARTIADSHSWDYTSGSQYPNRSIEFQRARVTGGCSSHNGCAAIWGHRADYDGWAALGNVGWSTDELLPLFRSASDALRVRIPSEKEISPFHAEMLRAAPYAGIPIVNDLNDLDESVGMAPSPANIWEGNRWNGAFAYLDPVREHRNLTIAGNVHVDRLNLENGRITGVFAIADGKPTIIRAGRVILAAGAYGSPAILLRSGIGEATGLRSLGIEPIHDRAGVGRNLHDHPSVRIDFGGTDQMVDSMNAFSGSSWTPEEQTIAKVRSSQTAEAFDIHIYPVSECPTEQQSNWVFQVPMACMSPRSRGRLTLRSADPLAAPMLDHGYLTDPDGSDLAVLADAMELARTLTASPRLATLLGKELGPLAEMRTRKQLLEFIPSVVEHYYHPVGTCKMGPAVDAEAVVDARGKIHGLEGGYVADCSIMPVVPRANTNVPAAVVGERIAAMLLNPDR